MLQLQNVDLSGKDKGIIIPIATIQFIEAPNVFTSLYNKFKGASLLWGDLDVDQQCNNTLIMVIKGSDGYIIDSLVPLKYHDASDIGSLILILIIPKEYTVHFPIDP